VYGTSKVGEGEAEAKVADSGDEEALFADVCLSWSGAPIICHVFAPNVSGPGPAPFPPPAPAPAPALSNGPDDEPGKIASAGGPGDVARWTVAVALTGPPHPAVPAAITFAVAAANDAASTLGSPPPPPSAGSAYVDGM
jgi:hypothetical protein